MYDQLVVVGKRLLLCSLELDDFVTSESNGALTAKDETDVSTLKYWTAFTSRADIVAEKVLVFLIHVLFC